MFDIDYWRPWVLYVVNVMKHTYNSKRLCISTVAVIFYNADVEIKRE